MTKAGIGYVYVLASDKSDCIKIGGTDHQPFKRAKEINSSEPYRSLGPWRVIDFRQVVDWRAVETHLHYRFRDTHAREIEGQRELFRIAQHAACAALAALEPESVTKRPVIDRMFQDAELWSYIRRLFELGGLLNWLEIQGAWSFTLFPATAGGRYFTINIDRHEVAFSTPPGNKHFGQQHMIVLDELVMDFPETVAWVKDRGGDFFELPYATAMNGGVSVQFSGPLEDAIAFLAQDGVRRALIAYWLDGLMRLKEKKSSSMFARFHNWNAVAEIRARMVAGED